MRSRDRYGSASMHRSTPLAGALAVTLLVAALVPFARPTPASAAGECGAYASETAAPPTIRVLRTATGAVDTVDFRTYVKNVLSREWISSWTTESLRSGAMAVKNYAWYQVIHWRGYTTAAGACFDVFDSTRDQHYDPSRPDIRAHGGRRGCHVGHAGAQGRAHLRHVLQRRGGRRGVRCEREWLADVPVGHSGLRAGRFERRADHGGLLPRRRRDRGTAAGRTPGAHAGAHTHSDAGTHSSRHCRPHRHRSPRRRRHRRFRRLPRPPRRRRQRRAGRPVAGRSGSSLRRPHRRPIPSRSS